MYGYIYLQLGAIVTAFLMGLLPGALLGNLFRGKGVDSVMVSEIVLFSLLVVFYVGSVSPKRYTAILFLGYGFIFAFWCGYQFPMAAGLIGEARSPAAGCLAADLTGAAVGTVATGAGSSRCWGSRRRQVF